MKRFLLIVAVAFGAAIALVPYEHLWVAAVLAALGCLAVAARNWAGIAEFCAEWRQAWKAHKAANEDDAALARRLEEVDDDNPAGLL